MAPVFLDRFHLPERHAFTSLSVCLFTELLLQEVVPLESAEEDEKRDKARATEATRCRTSGLPFTRVPALRTGGDLDGPRGRDTAASKPAWQTSLLPGHTQHRWAEIFQLQDRSRTGPVVTQVGTVSLPLLLFLLLSTLLPPQPSPSLLSSFLTRGRRNCYATLIDPNQLWPSNNHSLRERHVAIFDGAASYGGFRRSSRIPLKNTFEVYLVKLRFCAKNCIFSYRLSFKLKHVFKILGCKYLCWQLPLLDIFNFNRQR